MVEMKKWFSLVLAIFVVLGLCACGSTPSSNTTEQATEPTTEQTSPQTQVENESEVPDETEIPLLDLKQGDEVSVVGQKANSTLVNENTIWVQVQQKDGSFIIYHCQMKDEYVSAAGELKMLSVVKLKGLFLSYTDMKMENTSPLVTLYDCELIED